jgi:hypothetical protein
MKTILRNAVATSSTKGYWTRRSSSTTLECKMSILNQYTGRYSRGIQSTWDNELSCKSLNNLYFPFDNTNS